MHGWFLLGLSLLPPSLALPTPYYSFFVCNGLSNQRQCILESALLARNLSLGLRLPRVVRNGIQDLRQGIRPVLAVDASEGGGLPFSALFDEARFTAVLREWGVPPVAEAEVAEGPPPFEYPGGSFPLANYATSGLTSVATGCALFTSVGHRLAQTHEGFARAVLRGLAPAPPLAALADAVRAALAPGGAPYDALHLRYEKDWWHLCQLWREKPNSPDPRFCGLWEPAALVPLLRDNMGLGGRPLFVAVDEDAVEDRALLPRLRAAFPTLRTRRDLLPVGASPPLSRELGASVDYALCVGAALFVGNGYSTFSEFVILERQIAAGPRRGLLALPSRWYNGGDIPLEHFFPIMRFPWVFVAGPRRGGWDAGAPAAAAWSARRAGGFAPLALYAGERGADPQLEAFLEGAGVDVEYLGDAGVAERAAQLAAAAAEGAGGGAAGEAAAEEVRALLAALPPAGAAELALTATAAFAPALRGLHHALLTSPRVVMRQRFYTFYLGARLPSCYAAVRAWPPEGGAFSPAWAVAGLECLRARLPGLAAELAKWRGGGSGASSPPCWEALYHAAVNRAFRGLWAPVTPRWNAAAGAPLETHAMSFTGALGGGECAPVAWDACGARAPGEPGGAWTPPGVAAYRDAALEAAAGAVRFGGAEVDFWPRACSPQIREGMGRAEDVEDVDAPKPWGQGAPPAPAPVPAPVPASVPAAVPAPAPKPQNHFSKGLRGWVAAARSAHNSAPLLVLAALASALCACAVRIFSVKGGRRDKRSE
jgi:hypothetical protein